MVTYHPKDGNPQPKDGHPPEGSVVQTWNLALKFNSQNKSQVSTSMDGHLLSLGWSHTQPKDGHPPEGSVLQTWNLALKLNQIHKTKDG